MTQSVPSAVQTAIDDDRILIRDGLTLDFASGIERFWSGLGEVSLDAVTWKGAGTLIKVSRIDQDREGDAQNLSISLQSIPNTALTPDKVNTIETETYKGRAANYYSFYFDSETYEYLGSVLEFRGTMDTIDHDDLVDLEGYYRITLRVETRALDLKKQNGGVRGDQDQRKIDSTDRSLREAARAGQVDVDWAQEPERNGSREIARQRRR
jgi:hypothetical protein